jgi:hypothetical protein
VQRIEAIILEDGNRLQGELSHYEYGVVSIKMELPFDAGWQQLADLSSRWNFPLLEGFSRFCYPQ